jgi:hypothetical protein
MSGVFRCAIARATQLRGCCVGHEDGRDGPLQVMNSGYSALRFAGLAVLN